MRSTILFTALSGLAIATAQTPVPGTTGKLGNAAITEGNPAGVTYTAYLPDSKTSSIRGYVAATSNANGTGLVFNINLYGFPSASLGPFLYHIHDQPVPASGACAGTLAHLDPYVRGEIPPCDNTQPETCQVGDLSGKHGKITSSPFQTSYLDLYTSDTMGVGSFIGNRSITIHSSNTTRLACASFQLTSGPGNSTGGNTTSPTSPPKPFTGGAAPAVVGFGAVAAGIVAFFL